VDRKILPLHFEYPERNKSKNVAIFKDKVQSCRSQLTWNMLEACVMLCHVRESWFNEICLEKEKEQETEHRCNILEKDHVWALAGQQQYIREEKRFGRGRKIVFHHDWLRLYFHSSKSFLFRLLQQSDSTNLRGRKTEKKIRHGKTWLGKKISIGDNLLPWQWQLDM